MPVTKPSICFWKWVISIKGANKLLIHNINLTGIERVHVVYSSWFSWRYESLLRFDIGGPRFFPRVATTMISKCFCEIRYKSVLLNVIENMKYRWFVYYSSLLFTHLVKGAWRTEGWNQKQEIVFWWHDFLDFTWLYMTTFYLFSALCQRRYCCWNIESELASWKTVTIMQEW